MKKLSTNPIMAFNVTACGWSPVATAEPGNAHHFYCIVRVLDAAGAPVKNLIKLNFQIGATETPAGAPSCMLYYADPADPLDGIYLLQIRPQGDGKWVGGTYKLTVRAFLFPPSTESGLGAFNVVVMHDS